MERARQSRKKYEKHNGGKPLFTNDRVPFFIGRRPGTPRTIQPFLSLFGRSGKGLNLHVTAGVR
jgi:hypothetical protein